MFLCGEYRWHSQLCPLIPSSHTEACKSLKDPPAWEHQRSLCCSDNWNRTHGSMCNCDVNKAWSAVNRARPLTRGHSGKRMWHTTSTCDTHISLRGDKHVLTEFTFMHTPLCKSINMGTLVWTAKYPSVFAPARKTVCCKQILMIDKIIIIFFWRGGNFFAAASEIKYVLVVLYPHLNFAFFLTWIYRIWKKMSQLKCSYTGCPLQITVCHNSGIKLSDASHSHIHSCPLEKAMRHTQF